MKIVRLAARGDGIAEDGRAVPLAAPGDTLTAEGRIEPGPHHQPPPCRHFPACGGCTLQHVDDAVYAAYLAERVTGALGTQGLSGITIRAPYLSPPRTRRRASLRAERFGGRVAIGFNEAQSRRVIDLHECWILAPPLFDLIAPLRRLLARLLPDRRGAGVQMTLADQGVDLLLDGFEPDGLVAAEALTGFAAEQRLARLSIDSGFGAEARWEPQPVTVTLGDVAVPFPAAGFLQATADGEAALVQAVGEAVAGAGVIADLFSGLGTFALPLSARARVLAAEGARDAVLALKAAAARAGRPILADHRDLFRRPYSAAELSRFAAVLLDPPRAGAKEQAAELARAAAPRIAYVSCNPATFARDARTLVDGGWTIDWIQPVGQFRWSTHVELVAAFRR